MKPPAGAGAKSTFRVEDAAQLSAALEGAPPGRGRVLLLEEVIVGEEHSFDTVSLGGRPVWHSLSRYAPSPLTVIENPWIQWCVLVPREIDDPRYDYIRRVAFRSLEALGMGTGVTHMEWFRRRDGSLAVSEVAARPPGPQFCSLISWAHDFDFYAAWARSVVHGEFSGGGNPSLGSKWRFYENEANKLSFGIKPEIVLPVSSSKENQGLGVGKTSYGLTFIMTKEVPIGAVHANLFAGRERFRDPAISPDISYTRASIAPVWDVTDQWKLALDVGSESSKADNVRTRTDFAEIGVIFSPNKDLDFALGLIRSIDDQQPKTGVTSATLGVTWRFK